VFLSESDTGVHIHSLVRLLEAARDAGVVTMVHCEDSPVVDAATRRLVAEGRTSLRYYPASRPVAAEIAATAQVAAWCESTGAPLYVVHMSSARALEACQGTRRPGASLFVETRPLYLHLTEERMAGPDAALYVGEPPLRSASDSLELWRGLADGRIDVLGSDHAPFTRAQKTDPAVLSVSNHLAGMSDLQFMLPMYFSEGVHKRHLPLTRFVETTSTNAARIFGMYPRKGAIRTGSDADIVIWDPNRQGSVTAEADLSNADYSVYEGWKVTGWPVTTIRRGEIVYDAGQVSGRSGTGRLISRERWRQ
jgi:dihydropyrimidinase